MERSKWGQTKTNGRSIDFFLVNNNVPTSYVPSLTVKKKQNETELS